MNYHNYKADLHIHTYFSDGKYSPETILGKAKRTGLDAISITDHDSINGLSVAVDNCKKYGVEVIPGIEFSCDYSGNEVHLLGYFIDFKNIILEEYLRQFSQKRLDRIRKMVVNLNNLGFEMDADSFINSISSRISIGRPHLAAAMVKEGFVKSYVEAFVKYIGDGKPACEKKKNTDIKLIIELIRKLNGLSFVAHPGKNIDVEYLNELVKIGIDGIEIYHPSHTSSESKLFLDFSIKNNLLISGGTDFHGVIRADTRNWGKYFVGKEDIDRMKNKIQAIENKLQITV